MGPEQRWLDRIENLLQVQKDTGVELISANFTRRELIELRMMISTLMEIKRKEGDKNDT